MKVLASDSSRRWFFTCGFHGTVEDHDAVCYRISCKIDNDLERRKIPIAIRPLGSVNPGAIEVAPKVEVRSLVHVEKVPASMAIGASFAVGSAVGFLIALVVCL